MLDLAYGLKLLTQRNRDGCFGTKENREGMLRLFAEQLWQLKFKDFLRPEQLKGRHVEALVKLWQAEGIAPATVKNRLAVLRWWAEKVGKPSVLYRDNSAYGVERRQYVTNAQKAQVLDAVKWEAVKDEYVKLSLELQAAFGLRREEAIKFIVAYADQGDKLVLKASWTKGGKAREVPIRNAEQRALLDRVRQAVGKASLIPAHLSYVQQLKVYERHTNAAGFSKLHGLRHQYAQTRYWELTGRLAPAAGGKVAKELAQEEKQGDFEARMTISRELGHEREQITAVYLGR